MNEYDRLHHLAEQIAVEADKAARFSRAAIAIEDANGSPREAADLRTLSGEADTRLTAYINEHARILNQMRSDYPI